MPMREEAPFHMGLRYPLLNLLRRVTWSNVVSLREPYKLTYALTFRCNMTCTMCRAWEKPQVQELSVEEIDLLFSKYDRFQWVDLTGGEILLREDVQGVVATILRRLPHLYALHFPTNGSCAEGAQAIADQVLGVAKPPRLVITVSIDGPPAYHDKVRGRAGAWRDCIETFSALRRMKGPQVFFGITLSRLNVGILGETLDALRDELPDLKETDIHFNIAHNAPYYANAAVSLWDDASKEIATGVFRRRLRGQRASCTPFALLEKTFLREALSYLRTGMTPISCQALRASCFLAPDGTVFPCTMWDHPLGNIRANDHSLRRILRKADAKGVKNSIRNRHCPQCWTPCEAYQSLLARIDRLVLGGALGLR